MLLMKETKSSESGNVKKLNAVKKKEEEKNYCEKMFLTLLKRSIQTILRNLTVVKIKCVIYFYYFLWNIWLEM